MKITNIILMLTLTIFVACSNARQSATEKAKNASEKYFKAMRYFDQQNYATSLRMFEEFSKEYPLSKLHKSSVQMEIMLNIIAKNYATVEYLSELYKQSYTFDKDGVEYVEYAAIIAKIKNLKNIDISENNATIAEWKIKTFLAKYPNSKYISALKSYESKNHQLICDAGIKIAQKYCSMNNFLAAISKYSSILAECDSSSAEKLKFVESELLNIKKSIINGEYPECNKIA